MQSPYTWFEKTTLSITGDLSSIPLSFYKKKKKKNLPVKCGTIFPLKGSTIYEEQKKTWHAHSDPTSTPVRPDLFLPFSKSQ